MSKQFDLFTFAKHVLFIQICYMWRTVKVEQNSITRFYYLHIGKNKLKALYIDFGA